jgi:hypothetical protein
MCRVVSNGRIQPRAHSPGNPNNAALNGQSLNGTAHQPTFATTLHRGEHFTSAEWQSMALGWRNFQRDLEYAARAGVRVWRMKVCVLVATS